MYSTFGHSAMRVTDSSHHTDVVYNYGTFDFDDPNFYTKFAKGKLLYYLSTQDYDGFRKDYEEEKRGITEQVLNLNCKEKERLYRLLIQNLEGNNKFYKYDFLFDNCTTRLRDLLKNSADSGIYYKRIAFPKARFRQLIYEYLDHNDKQWGKLAIDIFLGARVDAIMTNEQSMFLPDYLMKGFDSGYIASKPVVSSKGSILLYTGNANNRNYFADPIFIFSLLFIIVVLLSSSDNSKVKKALVFFDIFFFFLIGMIGIMLLFMWFVSDHTLCKDNYNLLWAVPTHAVIALFLGSKRKWVQGYLKCNALLCSLLLLAWIFLPQHLNTSLIPIVLILLFRSLRRRAINSIS